MNTDGNPYTLVQHATNCFIVDMITYAENNPSFHIDIDPSVGDVCAFSNNEGFDAARDCCMCGGGDDIDGNSVRRSLETEKIPSISMEVAQLAKETIESVMGVAKRPARHHEFPELEDSMRHVQSFQELVQCMTVITIHDEDSPRMTAFMSNLKKIGADTSRIRIQREMPDPEHSSRGVWNAHTGAWQWGLDNDCDSMLVFEDDAFFSNDEATERGMLNAMEFILSDVPYDMMLLGFASKFEESLRQTSLDVAVADAIMTSISDGDAFFGGGEVEIALHRCDEGDYDDVEFCGDSQSTDFETIAIARVEYVFQMRCDQTVTDCTFGAIIERISNNFCLPTDLVVISDRSSTTATITCGPTTITLIKPDRRTRRMLSTDSTLDVDIEAEAPVSELVQHVSLFYLNETVTSIGGSVVGALNGSFSVEVELAVNESSSLTVSDLDNLASTANVTSGVEDAATAGGIDIDDITVVEETPDTTTPAPTSEETTTPSPTPEETTSAPGDDVSDDSSDMVIPIAAGAGGAVFVLILLFFFMRNKSNKNAQVGIGDDGYGGDKGYADSGSTKTSSY
eukprot:g4486.t1